MSLKSVEAAFLCLGFLLLSSGTLKSEGFCLELFRTMSLFVTYACGRSGVSAVMLLDSVMLDDSL